MISKFNNLISITYLICATLSAQWDTICKTKGYDSGYADSKGLGHCVDNKGKLDDFIHGRINLGPQPLVPSRDPQEKTGRLFLSPGYEFKDGTDYQTLEPD